MPKDTFEVTVTVENMPEFMKALREFNPNLKSDMFPTIQKVASKLERAYKAAAPVKTGRLQRMTYCIAIFNPLGLEMGSLAEYAFWTETPHGTWPGGWFANAYNRNIWRIIEGFQRALKRAIKKYQDRVR